MPNEMNAFFAALKLQEETFQDYVLISLYTGARRTNVLEIRWEDINFQLAVWRIPKTKNKDAHYVPLTSSAMELLRRRSDARARSRVFPGKKPGSHLVEPMKAWRRMLKQAEITNLRLHDLRRTLGSYMAMSNQKIKIISQALGHKSMASTEIYQVDARSGAIGYGKCTSSNADVYRSRHAITLCRFEVKNLTD